MIPRGLVAALAAALSASPAAAELHFDQLSACEGLSALMASLQSTPTDCRPPRGEIERWFANRLRILPDTLVCFLGRPPAASLTGFDCFVVEARPSRMIACLRPAEPDDIADYRPNYDTRYAETVNRYLERAAQCSAGNGDATVAPRTMLPFMVGLFARHDFAFVLPVGDRFRGSSAIVHGYAHVDPTIVDEPEPTIEYVSAWVNR